MKFGALRCPIDIGFPTREFAIAPSAHPERARFIRRQSSCDSLERLGPFADMLQSELGVSREKLLKEISRIHKEANGSIRDDVLRHKIKQHFKPEIYRRLLKGTPEESYQSLRRITDNLAPADKGSLAEFWYHKQYAPNAKAHVGISKDELAKAGVTLDSDRVADLVDGSGLIEIKSGADGLSSRDLKQIEDFQKVRRKEISTDGHKNGAAAEAGKATTEIKTVTVVFTNPEGALKGLRQLKEQLRWKSLNVEFFDSTGVRHIVNDAASRQTAIQKLSSQVIGIAK